MDLLFNDLSLHGQFADLNSFRESIRRVMRIRAIAQRHARSVYCHRALLNCQVTSQETMPVAVNGLPLNERRAVMVWLSQEGPFWDDDPNHDGGDWYECDGKIVTETALGEAAHCLRLGVDRGLVSLAPSDFTRDPVTVEQVLGEHDRYPVQIQNYWEPDAVELFLASARPPLASWAALRMLAVERFQHLTFAANAFEPLLGQPFNKRVAESILARLEKLYQLKQCFGADGSRTEDGHGIYQDYFTGANGWFSDESDSNKVDFKSKLTFPNPDVLGDTIVCSWHGKVKRPQYRFHFSWPVTADAPVYVVYVGPKITKK